MDVGERSGCGDQVCQETSDLAEGEGNETVPVGWSAPFSAAAAVMARKAWATITNVMWRYQAS